MAEQQAQSRGHAVDMTDRLAQAVIDAGYEEASEPTSDFNVGDIVHQPTADLPLAIGLVEVVRQGWRRVYSTVDGSPRDIPAHLVEMTLKKLSNHPGYPELLGKPAFSIRPTKKYRLGTHLCRLHRRRPEWLLYAGWGLEPCASEHFPSEYEVRRHMETDHPNNWKAILEYEEQKEKEREQHTMADILNRLVQRTEGSAAPLSEDMDARSESTSDSGLAELVRTTVREVLSNTQSKPQKPRKARKVQGSRAEIERTCPECEERFTSTFGPAVTNKLKAHREKVHGIA